MLQADMIPQISQLRIQSLTFSMSSTHTSCKLSPSSKMCRRTCTVFWISEADLRFANRETPFEYV